MCTEIDIDTEEFLNQRRKDIEASIVYFRCENKEIRDRWVVSEFLHNLDIEFNEQDIITPEDDPPDVIYHDANFELKEILDPGRRRGDEYKALFEHANKATSIDELVTDFSPKDITPSEISSLVLDLLNSLSNKYEPKFQETLNLLVYVNFLEHFVKPGEILPSSKFEAFGWRSVSAVCGWYSIIFHARNESPDFIKNNSGIPIVRNFNNENT